MNMKVIKRDGRIVDFDFSKIENAVSNAARSSGVTCTSMLRESDFKWGEDPISVEKIQDAVEKWLMKNEPEIAKEYILYREKHKETRFIKERIDYMNRYSQSADNAATSSETDANANITMKNVANLESEVYKTTNRIIQRQRMKDKLSELYPEVAKQYVADLEHHIIYAHDESSTPVPKAYCFAVSLYPLFEKGTSTMDGLQTTAPKGLDAFCGQIINLLFLLSSQCKGAVGMGELFNFFDHACVQEFGEEYDLHDQEYADSEFSKRRKTISQRIEQAFQNIVYSWNQSAGNRGAQSPFSNVNYFDKYYWDSLFGNFVFPDGTKPEWRRVSYLQKKFMKWFNKERTKTLLTFPVESMCLLNDGKDYVDTEYRDFAAEMWAEGHSFFLYTSDNADSVASCCRLRNDVKLFSSTTGLTGIEVGSCNVITLNLNRIVQDWMHSSEVSFEQYLEDILERVYKYHVAYKEILYDWEKRGMMTASNAGYIHIKKLYSTFGINGINEAAEYMGYKVSNNEDYKSFVTKLLTHISDFIKAHNSPRYMLNLELVPAEELGIKNYNWDKADGYWVPENRNLYNSYIYDAHDPNTSILDRFVLQGGEIAKAVSGGQAVHCNLDAHLSKEQYLKLMMFAVEQGTNYFTFNIPNTSCNDCGKIYKQPLTKCPNCGSEHMTQWTRVIGFLRPLTAFSQGRYIEAQKRIYSDGNKELK
jgi:ribonucleoside-triphosphate reductase (formate)